MRQEELVETVWSCHPGVDPSGLLPGARAVHTLAGSQVLVVAIGSPGPGMLPGFNPTPGTHQVILELPGGYELLDSEIESLELAKSLAEDYANE